MSRYSMNRWGRAVVRMGAFLLFCSLAAAGPEEPTAMPESPTPTRVRLDTSEGEIVLELFDTDAPETVRNFLAYVEDGSYDGTIFHRVIDTFMIQGGGFTPELQQKPTRAPIRNEANNGRKNRRGKIAMARTSEVHSATAQFFINVVDNAFLDHRAENPRDFGYCVFGRVVEGMDVVDAIRRTPKVNRGGAFTDLPAETITIRKAARVEP